MSALLVDVVDADFIRLTANNVSGFQYYDWFRPLPIMLIDGLVRLHSPIPQYAPDNCGIGISTIGCDVVGLCDYRNKLFYNTTTSKANLLGKITYQH